MSTMKQKKYNEFYTFFKQINQSNPHKTDNKDIKISLRVTNKESC